MSDDEDRSLIGGLRERVGERLDKVNEIKDSLTGKIGEMRETAEENADIAKDLASIQGKNMKSEGQFLKKIFQSKDMVFMKTDASAIVLRKLGGNEEFLELFDKLTREGYRLVHQESVRNIPLGFGFNYPLGNLYFFQHVKFIGIR